eukprot:m.30856 g.30856  ORF g.30856 m.30856 type:complete len:446 (-) comp9274_c0_seq2:311-1648(-)
MAEGEQELNLWHSILSDVAAHTASRRLPLRSAIVLGDEGAGKSSLVARLQGRKHANEEHAQGTGLEYSYIDVKDEDSGEEVITRLGVYTLDNSSDYKSLLPFVMTKENLETFLVVIVLDMSRPWTALQSLDQWLKVLDTHMKSLEAPNLDELRAKVIADYQAYSETGTAPADDGEQIALPLEAGVLTFNLGLPVIVVANKSDMADALERDFDYRNEHFEFIQMHLRKACLRYGAALLYSNKDPRTRDLLSRYIAHRAFGFSLAAKANISDRDAVFVPSGWDNEKKIAMLHAGLKTISPDDPFDMHIVGSQPIKVGASADIIAEDEQDFLRKQAAVLASNPKESAPLAKPTSGAMPSPAPAASTAAARSAASPAPARQPSVTATKAAANGTPSKDGAAKPGAPLNNDMLANFFNSLLKKPAAGATGAAAGTGAAGAAPPSKGDAPK